MSLISRIGIAPAEAVNTVFSCSYHHRAMVAVTTIPAGSHSWKENDRDDRWPRKLDPRTQKLYNG